MKKSTILMISILVGLFGISFAVRDALALDAPHNTNDSVGWPITCSQCHYPAASVPTWATDPTGTDTTFKNNLCTSCHSGNILSSSRFNDVKTHSADNTGSSYWGGAWTVECVVCHNPHAQPQVAVADPDVNILTGVVGTITTSPGAVTSSLTTTTVLTPGQYEDYLLIPNVAYPTRIYRIASNTGNSITVTGALNPNYTAAGKTFAIRYGKMVPTAVSYPSKGIYAPSVKFFNKTGADSFGYSTGAGAANTAICQVCHTQTTSFKNTGVLEAGAHPAGVAGVQACTDCHAHSSGFKVGGCTNCHGSPPSSSANLIFKSRLSVTVVSDSPGAGAHVKHTSSAGYSCDTCHTGGMLGGANQGDDRLNLKFTLNGDLGGNYDGKSGRTVYPYLGGAPTTVSTGDTLQCSNLYCHSTVQAADGGAGNPTYRTPSWTGTVVCGSCHNADGVQGNATLMSTGSHTRHLAASVGATCDSCHSGAEHANRNIEVTNSYTASAQGAPGNGYGSCSAATCHMSPYADTMVATPTWGTASGCSACHSVAIAATGPNTGSHATHNDTTCTDCHNAGTTSATAPSTGHIDGDIDVTGGYPPNVAKHAAGSYTGTCSSASCHQSGISVNAYVTTPVWSTNAPNCSVCHAATPATGAHGVHVNASSYDCSQCHTGAIKDTSYASAQHRDLNIDVAVGGYTANKGLGTAKLSCTNTCHGTSSPVWDNTASVKGDCSLCHGMAANAADGRDTAGNTAATDTEVGAHVAHLTGVSNYSSAISCTECHTDPNATAGSYMDKVNTAGHIDGDNQAEVPMNGTLARFNSATPSYNFGTGTCSNVYCHGAKMINLSTTGTDTAPEWNQTGYLTSTPAKVGDCNKCHGAPPTGYAGSSHSGSETLAQCTGCHEHVNADGTFGNKALHMDGLVQASGCTSCHGQPPIDAATMVVSPNPTGRATLFASSNGGAGSHAFHVTSKNYGCDKCHSGGGGAGHQTSAKMTFGFTYGLSKGSYTAPALSNGFTFTAGNAGTTVATSGSTRSCSNYCHSSGQAANGGVGDPVWAVADWDNTASGDCGACHATGTMATGSHTKHLAQSTNCGNCHTGAALASYASTSHVNQLIDVASSYNRGGAAGNGYGTCSTLCHSTNLSSVATPTWGQTATCASCHASAPATGSHTGHLAATGLGVNCGSCHSGAVQDSSGGTAHVDGDIDVTNSYPANVAKHAVGSYTGTCTTVCHSTSVTAIATPTWGQTATCASCHASAPATGSHSPHLASAGVNCSSCHSGAVQDSNAGTAHFDNNIDVTNSYPANVAKHAVGSYTGNCTTTCHSTSLTSVATPTWGQTATCASCHASAPATGSHTSHLAATGLGVNCASCHAGAVQDSNPGTAHGDQNIDVTNSYPANVAKHAVGSYTGNCTTICHSTSLTSVATPTWGQTATCATCHATAPATGSHTKHLAAAGVNCGSCHNGAVQGSNAGTAHFDNNIDVTGGYPANVAKHAVGSYTGNCTTTCHSTSLTSVATPTWGQTSTCASCHATAPATGSHTNHLAVAGVNCGSCHNGAVQGSNAGTAHLDGDIDVIVGYPTNVAKHAVGTYTGSCSAASCHGSSSATWGPNTTYNTCTKCHGQKTIGTIDGTNRYLVAPPVSLASTTGTLTGTGQVSNIAAVGAHQTHLRLYNGLTSSAIQSLDGRCVNCHGTLPTVGTHANGVSAPTFTSLATRFGAMSPGTYVGTTCNNTYCHNPAGTGGLLAASSAGTGTAPVWTNANYIADGTLKTSANCGTCHKVPESPVNPLWNYSTTHSTYTIASDCSGCHTHNGTGNTHMDGIKQASGACNSCHGYGPTATDGKAQRAVEGKGAHEKHVNHLVVRWGGTLNPNTDAFGSGAAWTNVCGVCHNGATHNMSEPVGGTGRTIAIPAAYQFGPSGPVYNGAIGVSSATTPKNCSNVSCHFQTTPVWSAY